MHIIIWEITFFWAQIFSDFVSRAPVIRKSSKLFCFCWRQSNVFVHLALDFIAFCILLYIHEYIFDCWIGALCIDLLSTALCCCRLCMQIYIHVDSISRRFVVSLLLFFSSAPSSFIASFLRCIALLFILLKKNTRSSCR